MVLKTAHGNRLVTIVVAKFRYLYNLNTLFREQGVRIVLGENLNANMASL